MDIKKNLEQMFNFHDKSRIKREDKKITKPSKIYILELDRQTNGQSNIVPALVW